jgi:hypothetical protein
MLQYVVDNKGTDKSADLRLASETGGWEVIGIGAEFS